jgi:hypothetical protein
VAVAAGDDRPGVTSATPVLDLSTGVARPEALALAAECRLSNSEHMTHASIVIAASAVLVALIGAVLKERGLFTLNNRIRLHVELMQEAPSENLKDLLDDEVARVVQRDRHYLKRPASSWAAEVLVWFCMAGAVFLFVRATLKLIDAVRQGVPLSLGLGDWLPMILLGVVVSLVVFLPGPWQMSETAPVETTGGTSDDDLDDAKAP